ncbi:MULTISPECIES: cyclophane-forming radical SAM/SPASM peptide maturase YhhB [Azospirillum]|uniref:Cyclophane-forming radical SAM/SPASM peptide maturase YhhB n=2 Tax=Azospirillum brasilense TaxID=192 RepID=A0ABU4P8T1_AZOBR|nr:MULTISPECIES: cyclophane-forming radical SAM/SPASM peptide maturase YhhB [Azospirillum]ALJ36348.1 FxsB family radical SAM/SPASM domain protein [Azospirillum brasilense]MDW7557801.1 cyclophane-forming radical SAM/SPASM peptide maturase YhhB [Azospirillum brasilense]MDW7597435.1 cyclophane-forming radical SAM/SPASM peptide maturase YhhB [Azospirillum brasilense]MDW7632698.1 cyclophane-forming radical SAM/SPASM peptide maturase YhhB [Azospirillum brasilense]MDX5952441.1 cyclophane-forming radi
MEAARISSFLVKIASRCNLDCDYCYMYHHADQAWRDMPRFLSPSHQTAFANRLVEYLGERAINRVAVIFHGGEPLLAGAEELAAFARLLRQTVGERAQIDVGLQTNGLLLTDEALDLLEEETISVSLSLDGPRDVNDRHRLTRRGGSSFDGAYAALERLCARPSLFAGVIAVVDPEVPPSKILEFFDRHSPPKLDFLLPDANHVRPPPGRDADADLYLRWLVEAFDLWFDRYAHLPLRLFEALLDAVAGLPSGTDAFGFGDVSLITIETDGTYHDLDVLKVTAEGATKLVGSLDDTPIGLAAGSPQMQRHRRLLCPDGLAPKCRSCPEVDVCGGGSVPHRYAADGFAQPTVYCREMLGLIRHVRRRLAQTVVPAAPPLVRTAGTEIDLAAFERAETGRAVMEHLWNLARSEWTGGLTEAFTSMGVEASGLSTHRLADLACCPGTVAWQGAVRRFERYGAAQAVDGSPVQLDPDYGRYLLDRGGSGEALPGSLRFGANDPWLRLPFGGSVEFEGADVVESARATFSEAMAIVEAWRPALAAEMRAVCPDVQVIRDPSAHPDKIVSFSDNAVPGALFVSVRTSSGLISAHDLADSLVHEHRHQKLYLLERLQPIVEPTKRLIVSPWREDLRPPSGLFHAVFVFVELRRLWMHVRETSTGDLASRAAGTISETDRRLGEGIATLRDCPLTGFGRTLLDILEGEAALAAC